MGQSLRAAGALFVLGLLARPALAEPVTLLCDSDSNNYLYMDEPAVVQFDEQQRTVSIRIPAQHVRNPGSARGGFDGRGGSGPESYGPAPGEFTPERINFFPSNYRGERMCWSIDRMTGKLRGHMTPTCTGRNTDQSAWWSMACRPAKPKF